MNLLRSYRWKLLVKISSMLLLAFIILNLLITDKMVLEIIGFCEILAAFVILADLSMTYARARNKNTFIKRNIVMILLSIPISLLSIFLRNIETFLPPQTLRRLVPQVVIVERIGWLQKGAQLLRTIWKKISRH